jgi:hypothetical protein
MASLISTILEFIADGAFYHRRQMKMFSEQRRRLFIGATVPDLISGAA